jgi:hypothetical protein
MAVDLSNLFRKPTVLEMTESGALAVDEVCTSYAALKAALPGFAVALLRPRWTAAIVLRLVADDGRLLAPDLFGPMQVNHFAKLERGFHNFLFSINQWIEYDTEVCPRGSDAQMLIAGKDFYFFNNTAPVAIPDDRYSTQDRDTALARVRASKAYLGQPTGHESLGDEAQFRDTLPWIFSRGIR